MDDDDSPGLRKERDQETGQLDDNSAKTTNGRVGYTRHDYWEERYRHEDHFEWLDMGGGYRPMLQQLQRDLGPPSRRPRILVVACGNSHLSVDLARLEYDNILSTDYSATVVQFQSERHRHEQLQWRVADMTDLRDLADRSIDAVIEKAGLDAFLAEEKSAWQPSDDARRRINRALAEFARVLKPGGQFISITFAQPHFRLPFYAQESLGWSVDWTSPSAHEVAEEGEQVRKGDSLEFYYYKMIKGGSLDWTKIKPSLNLNQHLKIESVDNPPESSDEEDFMQKIGV